LLVSAAQGASTLSLLASKDFPFDADHSVLEYSISPLGAIEYLANEKSYSVSPLGNFFDIIYKAARRYKCHKSGVLRVV
jgi:hypothetical protein